MNGAVVPDPEDVPVESLRVAWDALLDPHVVLEPIRDDAGTIVDLAYRDVNDAAGAYLRRRPEELLGFGVRQIFSGEAADSLLLWCREAADAGEPVVLDDQLMVSAVAGVQRWFDVRASRVGTMVSLTWRDVTERHETAARLAESEAAFRILAAHSADVVLRTDLTHCITWASPSVQEILGWDPEELIGKQTRELLHPYDLQVMVQRRRELQDSGEVAGRFEARFATANGRWRWMSGVGRAILDEAGNIVGGVDALRDIEAEHNAAQALADSEAHFRLLAEHSTDVVLRVTLDGRISWASPSSKRTMGWEPGMLMGRSALELVHPADRDAAERGWLLRVSDTRHQSVTVRVRRGDGRYIYLEGASEVVAATATVPTFRVVRLRDVDVQERTFRELARSEQRFRTAMDSAPIGMSVEGLDRRFLQVNPALAAMVGRTAEWLLARTFADVLHPDDDAADEASRELLLAGREDRVTNEIRLLRADGSVLWVQHSMGASRDENWEPLTVVSQLVDITEARRARSLLEFLADHDPLTDLKNRRAIMSELSARVTDHPENAAGVGVLYTDLDGLKPVNDRLGHAAGDRLILGVARRFSRALRPDDTLGRIGGDEFVALLHRVGDEAEALAIADKVRRAVSVPLDIDGVTVIPTISIGVALTRPDEEPEAVLRRADQALYRGKKAGGDQTVLYDAGVDG